MSVCIYKAMPGEPIKQGLHLLTTLPPYLQSGPLTLSTGTPQDVCFPIVI